MAEPNRRRAIHVYLPEDVHEAWHLRADRLGITVTDLVHVLGQHLDQVVGAETESGLDPSQVLAECRALNASKRRRKGKSL